MALSGVGAAIVTSLLEQTGSDWNYSRGPAIHELRFFVTDLPPMIIGVEGGEGQGTEVLVAAFRGVLADLQASFDEPKRGDRITNGLITYEVQPIFDKCYYTVGGLIHIHAKRVSG